MKLTVAVFTVFVYFSSVQGFEDQSLQCYVGTAAKLDLVNCTVNEDEEAMGSGRQRRQMEGKDNASLPLNASLAIHEEDSNTVAEEEGGERRQSNSCLVFVPLLNASGNANNTNRMVHFDCDSHKICDENYKYENNKRENVTYRGRLGDLFCCKGSKCNEQHSAFPTRFAPSSDRPLRCSAGPNVKEPILCTTETLACYNRTTIVLNLTLEVHGCDLARLCTEKNRNTNGECSNFLDEHGRRMKLCCCTTNDCNAPPPTSQSLGFGVFADMKWVTYGWMAIAMVTLSVAVVVLVVRRRRNRMYSDISVISDPRYQRLTANFTAGDTDDVKMLLAD